jgi:hypothetical protein
MNPGRLFGTNRIVLVDETGRAYARLGVQVELDFQDGGRTLKVFVKEDTGWNSPEKVRARIQKALVEWIEKYRATRSTQSSPPKITGP